jgi:AbrB family looped-hinge helix DNA binding protein
MKIARSRITQQGQIYVPVEVRRLLGLAPGAVIQWDTEGDKVVVRRAGRYSSSDIHAAVFGKTRPRRRSLEEMDEAIASRMKEQRARR